jgi:hypothetical protein
MKHSDRGARDSAYSVSFVISLGSLKLPALEAGHFVELILIYHLRKHLRLHLPSLEYKINAISLIRMKRFLHVVVDAVSNSFM